MSTEISKKKTPKKGLHSKHTQTINQPKMPTSIANLTNKVHELIREDPKEAKRYLQRDMTDEVRKTVASKLLDGESALSLAVEVGTQKLVSYLLDKCECSVDLPWIGDLAWEGTKEKTEYTPLMKATLRGSLKMAKILLEHGADIDAVNDQGFSVLHGACAVGNATMVEFLITAGAKVNLKTKQGTTCLMNARRHAGIRGLLLDAGAELNAVNVFGRSALHQASMEGCCRSVVILLEKGADLSAKDAKGNTPLHLAVYNQNTDVVRELVKLGADLYDRNSDMEDVFLMAAANKNSAVTDVLMTSHREMCKHLDKNDSGVDLK